MVSLEKEAASLSASGEDTTDVVKAEPSTALTLREYIENILPAEKEKKSRPKYFCSTTKEGFIEMIDPLSGSTIALLGKKHKQDILECDRYIEIDNPKEPGKKVFVDQKINLDKFNHWVPANRGWSFSHMVADMICDRVTNGESLTKICASDSNLPSYGIVQRWRREHPEFNEAIKICFEMRAEADVDKNIEIAEKAQTEIGEDDSIVAAAKLVIDARKFRAGADNKKYAASKSAAGIENNGNVTFNFSSPIPQSEYAQEITGRTLSETGTVIEAKPDPEQDK